MDSDVLHEADVARRARIQALAEKGRGKLGEPIWFFDYMVRLYHGFYIRWFLKSLCAHME